MDAIKLENAEGYLAVLHRHRDIRQVIAGHVHLPGTALWRGIPMAALAGSHHPVRPDVPGVPDQQRQREGPARMAVVPAHPDGVTVHIQDHSDRHLTLAPGLFHQTSARPEHRRSPPPLHRRRGERLYGQAIGLYNKSYQTVVIPSSNPRIRARVAFIAAPERRQGT